MSVRALATLGLVGTALLGVGPTASSQSIDDRVAFVLDPQRLVARAREVIERSLGRGE